MSKIKLKQRDNGVYFVETTTDEGKRKRISLDTKDIKLAREGVRQWRLGVHPKQLKEASSPSVSLRADRKGNKGWTVSRALDRLLDTGGRDGWKDAKTQATIRSTIKVLNGYVGDELIANLDYERISRLIEQMRDDDYSPASIKKRIDALSKAVNMSSVWKDPETDKPYVQGKPKWPAIEVRNLQDRVLTFEEEQAVYAAINKRRAAEPRRNWWHYGCLVRILLDAGCRLGEALNLGSKSVIQKTTFDPVTGQHTQRLYLNLPRYSTKNDKPRHVPISDAVAALVPHLNELEVGGRWFPWEAGKTNTPWTMWNEIREDVKAGGKFDLSDVKQHTFRHTCATRLARGGPGVRGLSLERLSQWLGHSDISITAERYRHEVEDELSGGADVMNVLPTVAPFGNSNGQQSDIRKYDPEAGQRGTGVTTH